MQPDIRGEKIILKVTAAAIVLLCAMAVSCCLGSADISIGEVFKFFTGRKDELSRTTVVILQKIRVPRVVMGALVGGALATVGAVMQGIFRNPMADPSVLGISSGSALGAAITIVLGVDGAFLGGVFTGTYIGAMVGAAVTWLMVFVIAQQSGEYDMNSTLLAGIAISSIMSALITVLMTFHHENMERIYMWMLGSLSNSSYSEVGIMLGADIICVTMLFLLAPRIDVLKLGRETALTLGVKSSTTMGIVLCLSSILLACAVAATGIIGFVGLIIPHIVEFMGSHKMRSKLIMSFLIGAIFLVVCDAFAKTVVAPGEMAIGALTSLIGAPYFLWLLMKNRIIRRERGERS